MEREKEKKNNGNEGRILDRESRRHIQTKRGFNEWSNVSFIFKFT